MCIARLSIAALLATGLQAQVNVLTYHYDLARTGLNGNETVLTKAAVGSASFGKLFSVPVDGYVYAQPLYVGGVSVAGKGTRNVVYVATEHDSVYAFDADSGGAPLWQVSFLDTAHGVTTVPYLNVGCGQITPEIGITGTPVIDPASNTLYVVAMTLEQGTYAHRLHALDIGSGAERAGSPVLIQASYPGTGEGGSRVVFQAKAYKQRPGLLLLNGVVYTSWSSHCDIGTYHGWVIGYDAQTLAQVTVYNNTPDGNEGSFWAAGAAPAADANGNIYLVAGNGSFNGGSNLGETFSRLSSSGGLAVKDWFAPFNVAPLNDADLDLGSSGALLLPDEAGSAQHPHLLVSAGKEGRIYLLDRDQMGRFQASSDSQIPQSLPGAVGGLFGIPAYFRNTVYFSGANDRLKAFSLQNGLLTTQPVSQTTASFAYPGSVPTVSSNGTADGIVWSMEASERLQAYDAADLSKELASMSLGSYVKFTTPVVANGKVYCGTQNTLVVFGLSGPATVNVLVNTNVSGLGVAVDGASLTAPQTFAWTPGSNHTLAVDSPQAGATGIRYLFSGWSDAGAQSHSIAAPSSPATYTASFSTQYRLTRSVSPANAGQLNASPDPSDGYYDAGTTVQLTAVPQSQWTFTGFSGDLTGGTNPRSLTLSVPRSVTANFSALATATALRFVPVPPCRAVDTRLAAGPFGGPAIGALSSRDFAISQGVCGIPATAMAYSLNVTVAPARPLAYLSLWPTGQAQPLVSTLNSPAGRIKANAAIVPAGAGGAITVYATDPTDVVLDVGGYFAPSGQLAYYPVAPCRVADTRLAAGAFGGPGVSSGGTRTFAIPQSACGVPATAGAYSLNVTAVPSTTLGYLTVWPAGSPLPVVSTLNSPAGTVVANAAIVPAGANGGVSVYATDPTDVVLDINGYFGAPGLGGNSFYASSPCRVADTRNAPGIFGGPPLAAGETRTYPIAQSTCSAPVAAAYSLNVTAIPAALLGYLTLWPATGAAPFVSTLNSADGSVVSNAAIVAGNGTGAVNVYVTDPASVVLDINGYFAP